MKNKVRGLESCNERGVAVQQKEAGSGHTARWMIKMWSGREGSVSNHVQKEG